MERALRNRLTFGPIMLVGMCLLLWLDWRAEVRTFGKIQQPVSSSRHHHPATSPAALTTTALAPEPAVRYYGVGGIGLMVLLLIILPPATYELATLFAAEKVQPYRFIAAAGAGSLVVHAFLTQFPWFKEVAASSLAFIIVFTMLFAALRRAWGRQTEEAIHHMAGTVLATLYLGGMAWFLMALRVKHSSHDRFQGTTLVVLVILLVTKLTDVGAFFGGKALGRHKLIPWLSPGKTWEGLICGVMLGMGIALGLSHWVSALTWGKALIFGALLGGIGQLGDLLESLMKRDAEVKDSGHLIPGFGGVLDVIDSPLLAAPFAYLLFSLF